MLGSNSSILALDIGGQRIGLAKANAIARIPYPFQTIVNDGGTLGVLRQIVQEEQVAVVVVGLPRNLDGRDTAQTKIAMEFANTLRNHVTTPVYMQDEAVTSLKAEAELKGRGKPYEKGDIDALAATYILEDFLHDHPEIRV